MLSVFTGRLFEILKLPKSRVSETGKGFAVEFVVLGWLVLAANGFGAFPAGFVKPTGAAGFSPPNCSVILEANEEVVVVSGPNENPLEVCELFAGADPKLKVAFSVVFGFSAIFGFSKGFIELDMDGAVDCGSDFFGTGRALENGFALFEVVAD